MDENHFNTKIKEKETTEMERRRVMTTLLVLALTLTGVTAMAAGDFSMMGRKHGMRSGPMQLKTFLQLNLTESQRSQLMAIIDKYQSDREKARKQLQSARRRLVEVIRAGKFDEAEARKAFQRVSSLREDLFVSRMKMRAEMKTVLTPEQNALLERSRARGPHAGPHDSGCRFRNKAL